jgi:hypothetical protein
MLLLTLYGNNKLVKNLDVRFSAILPSSPFCGCLISRFVNVAIYSWTLTMVSKNRCSYFELMTCYGELFIGSRTGSSFLIRFNIIQDIQKYQRESYSTVLIDSFSPINEICDDQKNKGTINQLNEKNYTEEMHNGFLGIVWEDFKDIDIQKFYDQLCYRNLQLQRVTNRALVLPHFKIADMFISLGSIHDMCIGEIVSKTSFKIRFFKFIVKNVKCLRETERFGDQHTQYLLACTGGPRQGLLVVCNVKQSTTKHE